MNGKNDGALIEFAEEVELEVLVLRVAVGVVALDELNEVRP